MFEYSSRDCFHVLVKNNALKSEIAWLEKLREYILNNQFLFVCRRIMIFMKG